MVQGGTANPPDKDGFIENLVKYIVEKPGLVSNLECLYQHSLLGTQIEQVINSLNFPIIGKIALFHVFHY